MEKIEKPKEQTDPFHGSDWCWNYAAGFLDFREFPVPTQPTHPSIHVHRADSPSLFKEGPKREGEGGKPAHHRTSAVIDGLGDCHPFAVDG